MNTEKERIEKIMLDENLNASQFANEIGIKSPTISHILNGRNNPSLDVLKRILERYTNINSDWLILGVGPMYRHKNDSRELNLFFDEAVTGIESVSYPEKPIEKRENEILVKQSQIKAQAELKAETKQQIDKMTPKSIKKIIVYFDDNTFEEYFNK